MTSRTLVPCLAVLMVAPLVGCSISASSGSLSKSSRSSSHSSDSSSSSSPGAAERAYQEDVLGYLGGRVDTQWSLDFIPFVSAHAVDETWNVVERTTQWSYRRSRLNDMYPRESGLRVRLREFNVLTSTIYRRNDDDSFFLLFTDDVVAPRPLFGALNVAAGLGAGAVGLALLPFDRGALFLSGVRGVLFSVPELAFVNLRKGSFDYVPREDRPVDAGAEIAAAH